MSIPKNERPRIFDPSKAKAWDALKKLRRQRGMTVIDTFVNQLEEFHLVNHPYLVRELPEAKKKAIADYIRAAGTVAPFERQGRWVYFPWKHSLVHILVEKDFHKVRTNRNAELITFDEQKKFYETVVGIAGLSVGSNVALSVVLQGGARHIRLADYDALELSNTNRLIAGVDQLGMPKTTVIAHRIWEINPYAQIDLFDRGLTEENVGAFVDGIDIVVDEMDDFVIKQQLRELARKHRIALVSAADNGDRSTVDVERHDLAKRTPYFLGLLGKTSVARFRKLRGDKRETIRTIARLIGPENHPARMMASVPKIGETLVSVPQLGGTALMGAAVVTYCIRKIVSGQELPSGRSHVCMDENLAPGYHTAEACQERDTLADMLTKKLEL